MIDALRLIDHPLVATLGWTLTHFVWQGAVLGLFAFFILRVVRPAQASTRYLVGVVTLALMFLVPVGTFLSTAGQTASRQRASQNTAAGASVATAGLVTGAIVANLEANPAGVRALLPPNSSTTRGDQAPIAPVWLPIVTAVWMVGVTLLSLRMLGGWLLTQLLARRAVRAVTSEVEEAAREMARRLRLRRPFAVRESGAVAVPTLVGWVKPVVLLPAAALAGLSPMQLQAIIAHELAHVRRHDYLVNLLQTLVETVLFYHPAVWWVSSEIRAEREHCCDDLAVDVCGDRLVYVSALAELTSLERRAFALAATDGSLITRVRRILGRPGESRRELPPSWGILVLLVLVGGGAGTYEMSADASDVAEIARAASTPAQNTAPAAEVEREAASEEQAVAVTPRTPVTAVTPATPVPPVPAAAEITPAVPLSAAVDFVPMAPAVAAVVAIAPAVPATPRVAAREATQSVPSAPSAPSAPSTPSAPSAPTESSQNSSGNFVWTNDNERLTVRWTGKFRLSDDERDIAWVEDGATLTIADGWVFTDRVEFRGLPGDQVERKYYRSGFQRELDADGRAFLATVIQRMIRSGMFASERVARILKQGGPDAVLAEVDRLKSDSSHVKRVYYTALLKQADLNSAQLSRLLEKVASTMTSDFEKRMVMIQALQEGNVTEEQRALVARAAAKMSSDFEQRQVLAAALAAEKLAPAVVSAVLDALQTVNSNHERSTVLVDLARKGGVTPQNSERFMNSVTSMSSSHEQRKVLAALSASPAVADVVSRDSLKVVSALASSHDKAELLLQVVAKGDVTPESAPSFFSAVESVSSPHDKFRVLSALAARGRMADAMVPAFLRATKGITSSHERSRVLLALLKVQPLTGEHRTLFLEAAETIQSTSEQNQVLAALVRAERR